MYQCKIKLLYILAKSSKLSKLESSKDPSIGKGPQKPLGKGSIGRTKPRNLSEKLAMDDARSHPGEGTRLRQDLLTDPRWHHKDGWRKIARNINGHEIHHNYNDITKEVADFKFKY